MLLVVEIILRQLQRVWEDKLWENNWVVVAGKEVQADFFPTESAKRTSRSHKKNIFENVFQKSCWVIFDINFLWQFLEILEGKSQ